MTKPELNALIATVIVTIDDGRASILGGIPSGHLYAQLMDRVDIDTWLAITSHLKDAGLVTESHHLLTTTPTGTAMATRIRDLLTTAEREAQGVGL